MKNLMRMWPEQGMFRTLAISGLVVMISSLGWAQGGQGFFSSQINWSQTPDLYYQVTGAAPFTCGDLVTTRNGQALRASNWVCTDANGNATKGPFTWLNTPSDQTDRGAHIEWTNGTRTTSADHIWDKTCPTITGNSFSTYPSSFNGSASDGVWGAGFSSSWSSVKLQFYERTTQTYYDPATLTYHLTSPPTINATVSGLGSFTSPSYSITWSAAQLPPKSAHTNGYSYTWFALIGDGDTRCPGAAGSSYNQTFTFISTGGPGGGSNP